MRSIMRLRGGLLTVCTAALLAVTLAVPLRAAPFVWDGAPDGGGSSPDTLVTTGSNWVGDVAPNLAANPPVDDWIFGPSAATQVTFPGDAGASWFVKSITFQADAPAYTFSGTGPGADLPFPDITNNSPNMQVFNVAFNLQGGHVIKSAGGGLTFAGEYIYNNSSTAASSNRWWLTHDIVMNAPFWRNATHNVYGGKGPDTLPGDPAGTMYLNVGTGTANSNSNGNWIGRMNVWSGAVRVGHNNALGASANNNQNLFIRGTFATADAVVGQSGGGFDHGFGRLELHNDVTLTERVRIDSRTGDVADYDHVVNVSGNNVLGSAAANTGINQMGGAGHYNIASLSGRLTIGSGTSLFVSDPAQSGTTQVINSVWTFRGAGDIELAGRLGQEAGFVAPNVGREGEVSSLLRKQGTGTLILSGAGNDWDGGTLIEGGKVEVTASGSFSTVGARVHVADGAMLDVSATPGLSLAAGKRLSGGGTVKGDVTLAGGTIAPGGIGGLDGVEALAVAPGAGKLSINSSLDLSAGGSYEWQLASLSEAHPGVDFDVITLDGGLVLGGTSNLVIDLSLLGGMDPDSGHPFWDSNHTWKIIDAATHDGTGFMTLTNGTWSNGRHFTTSSGLGDGDVYLNYVVPEPATWGLLSVALLGCVRRRGK